jgi:predicted ester cyclase
LDPEAHKELARRLIDDVVNAGEAAALDELCTPAMADLAKDWVGPFRRSFPDVRMETVQMLAEGDTVVGRFKCSATHAGDWRGHPPTGRRFEDVDEVYFFRIEDGRIAEVWGLEDNASRLRQLGLD